MPADPARIAVLLLAAGRGERFGGGKLAAPLAGKPLARHSADRLAALAFASHMAVVAPGCPPLPGFATVALDPPGAPQSRSLALGIAAVAQQDVDAVLVALADMPLVPTDHFAAMIAAFDGDRLASGNGRTALPPALFARAHFEALLRLSGDRGAGALLAGAPVLPLPAGTALDVDRPDDLAAAEAWLHANPMALNG